MAAPPPPAPKHRVFLIPGFFGFANLGELRYFGHVRDLLPELLRARGLAADVHVVKTWPTWSLRRRAGLLLDTLAAVAAGDDAPIHLVGHSSGGLDARLLTTPDIQLPSTHALAPYVDRIKTVVTVSTPHHGTPVANFFTTLLGQQLLKTLSLATMYVLRFGQLPISVVLKLAGALAWVGAAAGFGRTTIDHLFDQLLGDFGPERRDAIERFFADVSSDQSLIPQLTPEGIDVLNAAAHDRPGVRYGSVVSRARRPGPATVWAAGASGYAQATHALHLALYRLASRTPRDRAPVPSDAQSAALRRAYGDLPDARANDSIVPTLSQVWGEVVHATWADHLDVVGHFDDPASEPPHFDWLATGTGFDRAHFVRLWTDVAAFISPG